MKAVVVYESHWGNTAEVARAIADGIGPDARVLPTDEASADVTADADLIVAGAPLMGFSLPTEDSLKNLGSNQGKAPSPPDLSHPSMRSWLEGLPPAKCRAAAFETRMKWSPGSSAKAILHGLQAAGCTAIGEPQRFVVRGAYGPLREGELDRARQWGAELASAIGSETGSGTAEAS